jgi:hypothetical protein
MVGKELIQGIPASAPARLQARLSARRLPLGLPLHRVLRYAQKTLALRETPRHLAALVWCGSTLHGDYPMLRFDAMPDVETHLALTGGTKWSGIGEPGVPPIAPAVCNAIFKITGKRICSLPLRNYDLSWV